MEKILLDEKYEQLLFQIPLLRDLPHNIKQSLLEKLEYSVYSIDKKDIVARQGTPCKKLYILLEGKLRVDIIDGLGNKVMVEYIVAPGPLHSPSLRQQHHHTCILVEVDHACRAFALGRRHHLFDDLFNRVGIAFHSPGQRPAA